MKLWVLMSSKTICCLQASKTKPCGESYLWAGTQAAGQEGTRVQGLRHAEGA